MKRILLIFVLFFSGVWGEDSKDSQWRGFFGVEAGAGVYGAYNAFILAPHPVFAIKKNSFGLGYSGGIAGGWQKHYEKIGLRHTLGFSFSYIPNISSVLEGSYSSCYFCKKKEKLDLKGAKAQLYDAYYAIEGLFDFARNNDFHMGVILGAKIGLTGTVGQPSDVGGFLAQFGIRTGLYTQVGNSVVDLTLSFPLFGGGIGIVLYDTPITLGYKYLF